MSNLHRTLRNVYLRESLDDAYSMIASELNDNARQMGINLPNAVVVNTNRVLKSINDIKDMSEGKVQWAGFGTSWFDWIRHNMPDWLAKYFYVLDINIENNDFFKVNSEVTLKMFSKLYIRNPNLPKDAAIDYQRLYDKQRYGVVFKPYKRTLAEPGSWYRSIDMDSVVIVNKKAIRSIKLLLDASEIIADYKDRSSDDF